MTPCRNRAPFTAFQSPRNRGYTQSIVNNDSNFCIQQATLVGKTTKRQTEIQYLCGVHSLISIIMRLGLLCLSHNYTLFHHFNRFVREICHCVQR